MPPAADISERDGFGIDETLTHRPQRLHQTVDRMSLSGYILGHSVLPYPRPDVGTQNPLAPCRQLPSRTIDGDSPKIAMVKNVAVCRLLE